MGNEILETMILFERTDNGRWPGVLRMDGGIRMGACVTKKQARYMARYQGLYAVLCKCPACGAMHLQNMTGKPNVMPRVYCPEHEHYRKND